jgi:CRP/FNR family transcriptional regulator, nitrogen oxide reductase regulator
LLVDATLLSLIEARKPRFFEGLTPSDIATILVPATRRTFPANKVITDEGSAADRLLLVLNGRARGFCVTSQGQKITMIWFSPGEIFGGAAFLFKQVKYLLSTEAVDNTTVLEWKRSAIRLLGAQFPRLHENLGHITLEYLVAYNQRLVAATCKTAGQRLAEVLTNHANEIGRGGPDGIEIELTNEELSEEASITIYTTSRLMSKWALEGLIAKGRGKVVVLSLAALSSLAGTFYGV